MNNTITANDLKTKGISAIEDSADDGIEIFITVRGRQRYVILSIDEFNRLRDGELNAALLESEEDIKNGRFDYSLEDHLKEIADA